MAAAWIGMDLTVQGQLKVDHTADQCIVAGNSSKINNFHYP